MIYSTSPRSLSVQWTRPAALGRDVSAVRQPRQEAPISLQPPVSASELQVALQAHDYMTEALEGETINRKAQAQMRLEEAKQRLALLKRWGFDPQTVARGAAQLAREVGAAAEDFAAAASTGQSADISTDTSSPETRDAIVPQAYRDMMERGAQSTSISQQDQRTNEAFQSLLREIKQVLQQAVRDLRREKSAEAADDALAAIEDALSVLENTRNGPTHRAGPFSILI